MKQYYRILCIWVVIALLLGALTPAVAAQEPQGAVDPQYVPPRPDLMEALQEQGALPKPGNGLNAAMSQAATEAAFQEYLAKKLGPKAFRDSAVQGRASGRSLQQAPPTSRILVVLAEYADLAHNGIPNPGSQNNT
ncbi:MAG: hypothetical protein FJ026_17955, partial [Chloroflexi bacterium]|nr:hypothetical protein [Chloroflexota bacterium]